MLSSRRLPPFASLQRQLSSTSTTTSPTNSPTATSPVVQDSYFESPDRPDQAPTMALPAEPIPVPPASPNILPPSPHLAGLGINGAPREPSPMGSDVDSALLSPISSSFPDNVSGSSPATSSLNSSPAASSLNASLAQRRGSSHTSPGPFNFQPMVASKSPVLTKPNQRRGHKYKHSSVSHQIFLEPPPRAPLTLPASLPFPTFRELIHSVSPSQRTRAVWCLCHLAVAAYTLYSAAGSLALTALSHLIVFDALGAFVCVTVDVLSNFEAWSRSSIRHPFGLERAEVLAGFAMSVFLLFMGFDICSHAAEHVVEGYWGGVDEHGHAGSEVHMEHMARISAGSVDFAAAAALGATLVSALGLGNHGRIGRAMAFERLTPLPSILSNPSHLLTLLTSLLLLLIPLLSLPLGASFDQALGLTMAVSMITIGVRLVKVLGSMLLMSYGGRGVNSVIDEIASMREVQEVQEARFWQVNHGLCIATVKLVAAEGIDAQIRLREKVGRLVRERLGGGVKGGAKWEVSVAITSAF